MNSSSQLVAARLLFLPLLMVVTVAWFEARPASIAGRPRGSSSPAWVDSTRSSPPTSIRSGSPSSLFVPSRPTAISLPPDDLGLIQRELRALSLTPLRATPPPAPPAISEREMGWGSPERPWIALTFDAEMGGEAGGPVLDTLRAWGVRATFFITGAWARRHPDLVQRMLAEGHPIGNHTDSHPRLIELSDEAIRQELRRAQATLLEVAGHDPRPWFRPPFGKRDARVRRIAAEEGYSTVVWSIDVVNWLEANSPQSMIDKALNEARNGSIIVFHLNRMDAEALPDIIQGLRARGYRLVTLAELLAP